MHIGQLAGEDVFSVPALARNQLWTMGLKAWKISEPKREEQSQEQNLMTGYSSS